MTLDTFRNAGAPLPPGIDLSTVATPADVDEAARLPARQTRILATMPPNALDKFSQHVCNYVATADTDKEIKSIAAEVGIDNLPSGPDVSPAAAKYFAALSANNSAHLMAQLLDTAESVCTTPEREQNPTTETRKIYTDSAPLMCR
ncbi:hypothetical protein [Nocardia sp. NPDC049149]|uniref:hypothetical protein n=1 Tax=Nocardia sp. NPDC049149 TaxID=3364315 RepID=UPI0037161FEA